MPISRPRTLDSTQAALPLSSEVACAAILDVPVLVVAATTNARMRIARALHEGSPRHAAPWFRFSYATDPPEELARSFARACGSTLFIDGIARMSQGDQYQLLALLEEFAAPRARRVRVVAGATPYLFDGVTARRFSEWLLYRLNVIRIDGPLDYCWMPEPGVGVTVRIRAAGA